MKESALEPVQGTIAHRWGSGGLGKMREQGTGRSRQLADRSI